MNRSMYNKYSYIKKNNLIYQKILTIKNLSAVQNYIDNIYYTILDTPILTKFMNHELGNYRNIYKIMINFNIFTLTYDLRFYKIKTQGGLETPRVIRDFNNLRYGEFNINFMIQNFGNYFDEIDSYNLLPILLKCRHRINMEYLKFVVLIYLVCQKKEIFLSKYIVKHIVGFII